MNKNKKKWIIGSCILLTFIMAFAFIWNVAKDDFKEDFISEEFKPQGVLILDENIEQDGTTTFTIETKDKEIVEINEKMYLKEINGKRYGANFDVNYLGNGKYTALISDNPINVYEDGGWKKYYNARSLKDKGWIVKKTYDDGKHDFEVIDFNASDFRFYSILKDSKNLNKNIPIKRNDEVISTFKHNKLTDKTKRIFKGDVLNENFTIGYNSTTVEITFTTTNEQLRFEGGYQNARNGLTATAVVGKGIMFGWNAASDWLYRSIRNYSLVSVPSGATITNATWQWNREQANTAAIPVYMVVRNVTVTSCVRNVDTGCFASFEGHTTDNTPYLGGNLTYSSDIARDLEPIAAGVWLNFTFNSEGLSRIQDANMGWDEFKFMVMGSHQVSNAGVVDIDSRIFYSSGGGGDTEYLFIEYTLPSSPYFTEGYPQTNSTDGNNKTAFDLNTIWMAYDNDVGDSLTYSIEWFKNNISNFTLTGLSYTNGTLTVDVLDKENLTTGDTWFSMVGVTDGTYTNYSNTSELLMLVTNLTFNTYDINSTFGKNITNDDIWANFSISSVEDTGATVNLTFYNDDVVNYSLEQYLLNETSLIIRFAYPNFSKDNVIYYGLIVNDSAGTFYQNSSTIRILNTELQGTPSLDTPVDFYTTPNYTIILNGSVNGISDNDSDPLNVEFWIEENANPPTTIVYNNTNLTSDINYSYALGGNGVYSWRIRVNDNSSVTSYTSVRNIVVNRSRIYAYTNTFNSQIVEGSIQNFTLNLTFNNQTVADITAALTYNNTEYSVTKTNETNIRFSFRTAIVVPIIESTPLVKNFNWNLTLRQLNQTLIYNTSIADTQTITALSFENCSDVANNNVTVTLNSFYEDTPEDPLDVKVDVEIDYWLNDPAVFKSLNLGLRGYNSTERWANSTYYICLTENATVYTDMYLRYTSEFGFTHRYYLVNETLNMDQPLNISLFNFNTTTGISNLEITTRVKDTYRYFSNLIVKLQRRYIDEGVWRTVQMDESGDFGGVFFNVKEESIDYRLIFSDRSNNVLKTTEQMKFVCDSGICDLTVLVDPYAAAGVSPDFAYTYSYNNETGVINVVWEDPLGLTSTVRVRVTKETLTGTTEICNDETSGSTGSYNCDTSAYTGEVFLEVHSSASPESPVISTWVRLVTQRLGNLISTSESVFWTFGIMVTIIGFGLTLGPVATVISSIIGLIIVFFLGSFTPLNITFVVISIIAGLVISFLIKD